MAQMDAESQFRKIAQGISELGTKQQRVAAAKDIFGRGFYELLPVLDKGSAGRAYLLK